MNLTIKDRVDGWVVVCAPPNLNINRLMGYNNAALLFRTRKDARQFINQWRDDTGDKGPLGIRHVVLQEAT